MNRLLSLALALPGAAVHAENWSTFVRQVQLDSELVWDMPVDLNGTAPSPLPLEENGALFQLWTLRAQDAREFVLDQKLVGTYLPAASIRILTADPYSRVPRTRADQPFTVEVDLDGLLSGIGLPDAATRVLFEHHLVGAESLTGELTAPDLVTGSTPFEQSLLTTNGTLTFEFPASSLPSEDPTQAQGEEHFAIHALADGAIPQAQLASAHVEVWPVASGRILGIESGQRIRFDAPAVQLELDDLYPSSTTYLQIYPGSEALGTSGKRVEGGTLALDQDRSEDRVIVLPRWTDMIAESGTYTMELVTVTPFGAERLDWRTFEIDRTLEVRAQVTTVESSGVPAVSTAP